MIMEEPMWIDLGLIGNKSNFLNKIMKPFYSIEIPQIIESNSSNTYLVFIDYKIGQESGTKVLTNAFINENCFYKRLSQIILLSYVETNKPLDFKSDF